MTGKESFHFQRPSILGCKVFLLLVGLVSVNHRGHWAPRMTGQHSRASSPQALHWCTPRQAEWSILCNGDKRKKKTPFSKTEQEETSAACSQRSHPSQRNSQRKSQCRHRRGRRRPGKGEGRGALGLHPQWRVPKPGGLRFPRGKAPPRPLPLAPPLCIMPPPLGAPPPEEKGGPPPRPSVASFCFVFFSSTFTLVSLI